MEFAVKLVGAVVLGVGIKLVVWLCGHRVSWRLSFLIGLIAVFSA